MELLQPTTLEDSEGFTYIDEMCSIINDWAKEKGWNEDKNKNVGEQLMLMTTEIAEGYEHYRGGKGLEVWLDETGKPDGLPIELADCVIRIMHFLAENNLSLEWLLQTKMAYNQKRPYRHGGKLA